MPYTEIKLRNSNEYYYRAISVRKNSKIGKKRIYIGKNLSKEELLEKEKISDKNFFKDKAKKNIAKLRPKIIFVLKKYNIRKAGIFGSYAKGQQKKNSDIDIIIEPPRGIGIKFVRISSDLEKVLRRKVDIITYKYINPYIKKNILDEEVRIM